MCANSPAASGRSPSSAWPTRLTMAAAWRRLWLAMMLLACSLGVHADPSPPPSPRSLHVVSDDNFPPLIFIGPDGQAEGYLVDLWKLWEQKTGIQVRLSALNWAEAQRMALSGEADVIDAIYRTAAREAQYEFSPAYAELPVAIFTHHTISGIHELASLHGFQVAVQEGDACIDLLLRNGITNLTRYRNYGLLLEAAVKGEVKIFCMDEYPAHYYLYRMKADQDFLKAFELYRGEVHRAVRKGQQATLAVVERGMALITAAERAELQHKWLKTADDTGRHLRLLGLLAAVMLVIGALLFVWVLSLRSAVRKKTAALEHEQGLLRESEQRFRKLFEETRQPIALLEEGRFVYANEATLSLLHLQAMEDLLGLTPVDLSPPVQADGQASAEKAAEMIRRTLESGTAFEWEHVRPDGTPFTAQIMLTPIRLGGRDLVHLVWNDISIQKQTERELAEYREHLEQLVAERTAALSALTATLRSTNAQQAAILDSASSGIVLLQNRVAIRCNRRLHEILGWPDGALEGQTTRIWYADDDTYLLAGNEAYEELGHGLTHHREQLMQRRDGSPVWTRMIGHAINVDDPDQGSVWIIDDITAEREAAQALQRATAKQRAIFDAAPVGLVYVNEGRLEAMNQRFIELFGYTQQEIPTLEAWWPTAYPDPDYRREVLASWNMALTRAAAQGGKVEPLEYRVSCKDGSQLNMLIGGQLMDEGMIATFTDVTLFRQAELTLRQARDAAEETARIKAAFLANMSHEIRTPLNAVMGMTTLALQADPPPRVRDYLQKIQSSSRHLLGIINDILDFSKIEAHKLRLEQAEFNLERVLADVTTLCADKAYAKGVEFVLDLAPDVPQRLIGDPLRLGQVLINLCNNAIKFTEKGEVVMGVSVQPGTAPRLCFRIRDTGIGIAAEQRQRLFESFQQADTSTTRRFGGTGLGLAISKRLVELMAGEIGVVSRPEQGSTFWFSIPLASAATQPPGRAPVLTGMKVLVVDANAAVRSVATTLVQGMGGTASTVAAALPALAELERADHEQRPFDLALVEWPLKDMSGIEFAHELGQRGLTHPPQLMVMTMHEPDLVRSRVMAVGIHRVLAKPLTASGLCDALARLSDHRNAMPTTPAGPGETGPQPGAALAGARVLLVEDNELNQEVASAFLAELGLRVDLAPDGAIALQKVQQQAYDVVLMDMQMPVLDGLAATRAIRKLPGRESLPILAMTANAMAADRERCLEAGMNDHIAKPIDPDDLSMKLLRWVRPDAALPTQADQTQPTTTGETAPPTFDPVVLRSVGLQLLQLLQADDFECTRFWSAHEALFRAALEEDFTHVDRAIAACDFERALQGLERGLGRHGIAA